MSYYRTRGMASLGAATFAGPKEYYAKLIPYVLTHGAHTVAWHKAHGYKFYPDDGVTKVPKSTTVEGLAKLFQNVQPRITIKGPFATFAEAKQKVDDANKSPGVLNKGRSVYSAFFAEVTSKVRMGSGASAAPVKVLARAGSPAGTVRGGGGGGGGGPLLEPPRLPGGDGGESPPAGGGGGESPPAGGGGPAAASPGGGQVVETDNVAVTEQGPVPATPDGRPAAAVASPAGVPTRTVLLIGGGLAVAYLLFGRKRP